MWINIEVAHVKWPQEKQLDSRELREEKKASFISVRKIYKNTLNKNFG